MEVESHTEQSFDGLGILWITNFQLIWKQAYTEVFCKIIILIKKIYL